MTTIGNTCSVIPYSLVDIATTTHSSRQGPSTRRGVTRVADSSGRTQIQTYVVQDSKNYSLRLGPALRAEDLMDDRWLSTTTGCTRLGLAELPATTVVAPARPLTAPFGPPLTRRADALSLVSSSESSVGLGALRRIGRRIGGIWTPSNFRCGLSSGWRCSDGGAISWCCLYKIA